MTTQTRQALAMAADMTGLIVMIALIFGGWVLLAPLDPINFAR